MQQKPRAKPWKLGLILVIALILSAWIYVTGPTTQPQEQRRPPKIVKTVTLSPTRQRITVSAYGSVIPARQVVVEPQVSGHVVRLSPQLIPGGRVRAGDELYAIDPRLAELSVSEAGAEVSRAEVDLKEAERKWQEGQRLAAEAVIPVTQLASLETSVRSNEAELARLRVREARTRELLERHVVHAPFNAIVLEEAVEIGQRVDLGDATATLVGTDEFWVRVSLPTDKVPWVRLPVGTQPGAAATVVLDTGGGPAARYPGRVIQLLGNMEEVGRMARILIQVEDPLKSAEAGRSAPLLLGSYVRVEIDAGELDNVMVIDRPALRENNRVWVVDARGRLQIREVSVRWRDEETVTIDATLKPGEQLIVSDLQVALPDMEVKAQPAKDSQPESAAQTSS